MCEPSVSYLFLPIFVAIPNSAGKPIGSMRTVSNFRLWRETEKDEKTKRIMQINKNRIINHHNWSDVIKIAIMNNSTSKCNSITLFFFPSNVTDYSCLYLSIKLHNLSLSIAKVRKSHAGALSERSSLPQRFSLSFFWTFSTPSHLPCAGGRHGRVHVHCVRLERQRPGRTGEAGRAAERAAHHPMDRQA